MNQTKRKVTQRAVAACAAFLVFLMIGSSFAYWSQELTTRNEHQLATYDTQIVEEFDAPDDWMPGVDINKDVQIENSGSMPVFVRVLLNQKWVRTENVYDLSGNLVAPAAGESFPLTFTSAAGQKYAALIDWGSDVVLLASGKTSVPSLSLGLPTVENAADAAGKWLLVKETPDDEGNYTLYYVGTLTSGNKTPLVIDGVSLNGAIEGTVLEDNTRYDKDRKEWVTEYVNNPTGSYENARYTLSVTMNTVQATADALTFDAQTTSEQGVVSHIASMCTDAKALDRSRDDSVTERRLYFDEVDGTMMFVPDHTTSENWFMSNLHMVPGGEYEHTLTIENKSDKEYALFLQAVPLEQEDKLNELLEYINMDVRHAGSLIYSGTALGKEYKEGTGTLHSAVYLGAYQPDLAGTIDVELSVDKDLPMEYAGLLTEIDWKFMVEEVVAPPEPEKPVTQPNTPVGPKTGDATESGTWYLVVMGIGAVLLLACVIYLVRSRKRAHDNATAGANDQ